MYDYLCNLLAECHRASDATAYARINVALATAILHAFMKSKGVTLQTTSSHFQSICQAYAVANNPDKIEEDVQNMLMIKQKYINYN